jgi:hypothetical protein
MGETRSRSFYVLAAFFTAYVLFLYGPFKREGQHTAISNAVFDTNLRTQNAEWGVRDVGDVERLAKDAGLELAETFEMPADNGILMFARSRSPA